MPDSEIATRYLAGESENALAKSFGVSRTAIRLRLESECITRRDKTTANRLLSQQTPIEEHHRRIKIAQEASRGRKQPIEHRIKIAKTRQENCTNASEAEYILADWLRLRGLDVIQQQAIGPYNIDLGIHPIAVEVFGGAWHAGKSTHQKRSRYILN